MSSERTPETDVIARVLNGWLADHGYPIASDSTATPVVPVDWLLDELVKIREGNPAEDARLVAGRRWNAAVDLVVRVIESYSSRRHIDEETPWPPPR